MKCDFKASFLAYAFANPCLGHEPKARVMTSSQNENNNNNNDEIYLNDVVMKEEILEGKFEIQSSLQTNIY